MLNLLSNATRHNPAGLPVQVPIERFVCADNTRAQRDGGTGLGLSIVSAIAAGHGGAARAEGAPGGGALSEVWIPAAQPR